MHHFLLFMSMIPRVSPVESPVSNLQYTQLIGRRLRINEFGLLEERIILKENVFVEGITLHCRADVQYLRVSFELAHLEEARNLLGRRSLHPLRMNILLY